MWESGITEKKIIILINIIVFVNFCGRKHGAVSINKLSLSPSAVMHMAKYCPMQSVSGMVLNELMQGSIEGRQRYKYNGNI